MSKFTRLSAERQTFNPFSSVAFALRNQSTARFGKNVRCCSAPPRISAEMSEPGRHVGPCLCERPMNRPNSVDFPEKTCGFITASGNKIEPVCRSKRKSEPERAALLVHFAENVGKPIFGGQFFRDAVGASGGKYQALFCRAEFCVGHSVEGFPIARFFA